MKALLYVVGILFAVIMALMGYLSLKLRAEEKKREREVEEIRQKYEEKERKEKERVEKKIQQTESLNTGDGKSDFLSTVEVLQELADRR